MNKHQHTESVTLSPASRSRRAIAWLTLVVYVGQPLAVSAQVVADSAASAQKRPVIDTTANGIPLVQIATPNASGLSHNQYTQYNVDRSGLILNNGANVSQTQQAGYVPGNQNLANGSARIILNEVTSTSPSQLNGYTEVAGSRAEVIIANPNGITCNGCGFINTSRGMLTTGTPVFGGSGSLDAFRVSGGEINIGASGLNAGNTSQLDLIARSVKANGELWANELNVIAGTNQVNYANLGVQVINGDANKPTIGIDVSLLGGMYANKIRLVGTEAGVGVNSQGNIATQAGDIVIDNQGQLTLAGTTSAGGNLNLNGSSFNVTGNLGAGIDSSGVATQGGAVAMTATGGNINNSGRIAGNAITSNSDTLTNTGILIGDNLSLSANTLNNQGSSAIIASTQRLDLIIQNTLNNQDGATLYSLGDLNVSSNNIIGADGYFSGRTAIVNNQSATIEAGNDLRISADQLTNQRSVVGVEWGPEALGAYVSGNPRYTPSYSDQQFTANTTPAAQMLAGNNLWLSANTLTNDYSTIAAGQALNVNATAVNNSGAAFLQRMTVTNGLQDIWVWGVVGGHSEWDWGWYWVNDWGWIKQTIPYAPAPTYTIIGSPNYTYAANTPPANQAVNSAALKVPSNGMYTIQAQPNQPYLVVTDPRFTSYQTFVSSDYMLDRLVMDPAMIQKRLGDGFYEQKLVAEQILQATGKRNLTGFSNIQSSYRALMDAALAESHELKLIPGVALTKDQIAALRHDIVWMVAEDVKMADGSTIKALAPKVYFSQTNQMKLSPGGALIAANEISFKSSGLFDNGGQIISDSASTLIVGDLVNRGSIQSAGAMYLQAANDISNLSGSISGQDVTIIAGRDIRNERTAKEIASTAAPSTASSDNGSLTGMVDRSIYAGSTSATELGLESGITSTNGLSVTADRNLTLVGANIKAGGDASLIAGKNITLDTLMTHQNSSAYSAYINSVTNLGSQLDAGGSLAMRSGNDMQLTAAKVNAGNDMSLVAAGDISLSAVKNSLSSGFDSAMGFGRHYDETVVGSSLNAGNNLTLVATRPQSGVRAEGDEKHRNSGGNINLQSATLNSNAGDLALIADGNVNVGETKERHYSLVQTSSEDRGFLSSTTTTDRTESDRSDAIGSSLGGNRILVKSGNDLTVKGSDVVSTYDTTLIAQNNLNLLASENTSSFSNYHHEEKSGFMSGGGLSISYGNQDLQNTQASRETTHTASNIGSINGNVVIQAGKDYTQTGSNVLTPQDNIDIAAQNVLINEAQNTGISISETKFSQSGLTLSLSNPVVDAANTAKQMDRAHGQTSSTRMKALAVASAALSANNAYDAVSKGLGMENGNVMDKVGGIKVSISAGSSSSESSTTQTWSQAQGSNLTAGGDIHISAKGAKQDSNITLQGSNLQAGNDTSLEADNAINLLAAKNTSEQHSTNQSSSASLGVSFNLGAKGTGFSVDAAMSRGRGNADGIDTTWSNSHVDAGNKLSLKSGGDTNLKGATASGKSVEADVGGNLNIESLQDTSTYASKQESVGFSASVPVAGNSYSASISASNSNIDGIYASVIEQSGIKARDEGFNVMVKGNTDLKGGVIASTEQAVQGHKNTLATATLTQSDIQNKADASADSSGFELSTDMMTQGKYGIAKGAIGNAINNGEASESSSGRTLSAVSGGSIVITDEIKQIELTGKSTQKTVEDLNRDTANAQIAAQRLDVQAMAQTAEAERGIKKAAFKEITVHTDAAYKAMFKTDTKFYKVSCSSTPEKCLNDPKLVHMEEVTREEAKADGKVLAANGILNDAPRAGQLAYQNAPDDKITGQKPESITLMHIPPANTGLGELFVAGYEKLLAPTLGYTNADVTYAELLQGRGDEATLSLGHSRGTIVQRNAFNIAADNGYTNSNMSVFGVGGGVSFQDYISSAARITKEVGNPSIDYTYMANDPVPVIAAGNPGDAWLAFKEFFNVVSSDNSAHSCYGTGAKGCVTISSPVPGGPMPTNQNSSLIRVYRGGE